MFFASLEAELITLFVTFLVTVIAYYKWTYQYWKRKNVPYLEPEIPFGNFKAAFKRGEHISVSAKGFYNIMKEKGWKHGGIYSSLNPLYLVIDLDLLKNIMSKDFQYFPNRGIYHNEKSDPLSANLLSIEGTKWKNLRAKLTPTFTSGKMKMMFQTLVDCEKGMRKKIQQDCEGKNPIDIKEVLGCYTTEIIGSCAFGLECKTFKDEDSPFRKYGRKIFERSLSRHLKRSFATNFPKIANMLNLVILPKDMTQFFIDMVKKTVDYREKNNVARKDFLQLLIDMKGEDKDDGNLSIEEIAAQSFVFFAAGFETSSTTMTFALYELAKNQELQDKLRNEIISVLDKHEGKMTYEAIQEMKYLGQVVDESLRMYPPAPILPRKCAKNYHVPETDVIIEKGTTVLIPILGIHHDKEYYPEPEKFDPERFSDENKQQRHSFAHIPFGEGPRNCIGMRFGLLQSKVGLASLLKNFRFTVNEKTQEPLRFKVRSLVLAAENEILLDAQPV